MIAARHGDFRSRPGEDCRDKDYSACDREGKDGAGKTSDRRWTDFSILPYVQKKIGLVTTGSEVYKRRIQDKFSPVIKEKLAEYGMEVAMHEICSDDHEQITAVIRAMLDAGMDMVICTGG